MNILITGSKVFVGRNLVVQLKRREGISANFRKEGVDAKINLQRDDGKAKAYQVRQVRAIILRYKMGGEL